MHLRAQVRALSPQKTLDRGYAVVELADGQARPWHRREVVRHPGGAGGDRLTVRVAGGRFTAQSNGGQNAHRGMTAGHNRARTNDQRRTTRPPGPARSTTWQQRQTERRHRGLSYEDASEQLVAVVGRLEAGGASLEESLALWERGEALAKRCEEWLEGARKRLAAARDHAAQED